MSNVDANGESILPYITDSEFVTFNLTGAQDYLGNLIEGFQTWYISNTGDQNDNIPSTTDATLIIVDQAPSSNAVSSYDSQFYDLTFSASGVYSYYSTASGDDPNVTPNTGVTKSVAQGYFPPVSTFPTESFFRGWGKSNYFESNPDGSVFRVTTGSGFSSDTLGNFNTGSVEEDFDTSTPYTSSVTPWFMNADSSTLQILNNSSLVGNSGATDLQLYTGSITASAVQIGPSFEVLSTITPVQASVFSSSIQQQQQPFLTTTCGAGMQGFGPTDIYTTPITVTTSDPTLSWNVSVVYQGNFSNWVTTSDNSGAPILSGTGNGTVNVGVVTDNSSPTSNLQTRTAKVFITNANNPNNNLFCSVAQNIYSGGTNQGFNPSP